MTIEPRFFTLALKPVVKVHGIIHIVKRFGDVLQAEEGSLYARRVTRAETIALSRTPDEDRPACLAYALILQ
jgi:hypothetical protein